MLSRLFAAGRYWRGAEDDESRALLAPEQRELVERVLAVERAGARQEQRRLDTADGLLAWSLRPCQKEAPTLRRWLYVHASELPSRLPATIALWRSGLRAATRVRL